MRTYGVHGGESQLFRYFGVAVPAGDVDAFFSLYEDRECHALFRKTGIGTRALLPVTLKPSRFLWLETLSLLALLPFLQLRLLWLLLRGGCKVCVVHGFQAAMVTWPAATLLRRCSFIYVHRGTKSSRGKHRLFRYLYRPFPVVAGVSRAVAASLKPLLGERDARVIENGIDWERIATSAAACRKGSSATFIVASVGRLIPGKGQDLLLQAFAVFLKTTMGGAEFWMVGDGPNRLMLESQARTLGIDSKVRFFGRIENVACMLGQIDVFTFASVSEGLSNAVLEAMAAGAPSVVVDAPGVTECHETGVTGFIVERSASAVADALAILFINPEMRNRMGAAAQQRVRNHYSLEVNRLRYRRLYEELGAFN